MEKKYNTDVLQILLWIELISLVIWKEEFDWPTHQLERLVSMLFPSIGDQREKLSLLMHYKLSTIYYK